MQKKTVLKWVMCAAPDYANTLHTQNNCAIKQLSLKQAVCPFYHHPLPKLAHDTQNIIQIV
jgi:hypothetical protein